MDLVTGGTGHIGNVLVRELLNRGREVRVLTLPGEDLTPIRGLSLETMEGDILDPAALERAMQGVEVVYHLAAIVNILPGREDFLRRVNVEGTKNVLAAARKCHVRRLVYTSSIHALARPPEGETISEEVSFDPHNPAGSYDRTKAEASLAVLQAVREGLDAVIVCPTGVIGPHDYRRSEVGLLLLDWMKFKLHVLIEGIFDFVDVRDVARGHILAAENGRCGQTYILSGEQISLKKMKELVQSTVGIHSQTWVLPFWMAYAITAFTPFYYKITRTKAQFTRYAIETVNSNSRISHEKARRELGFTPRALDISIPDTVRWFIENKSRLAAMQTILR